jgi:hypothetical protein
VGPGVGLSNRLPVGYDWSVAHVRRWLPFAAAVLATALLASGVGVAANRLATPRSQPVPQLKTVSPAALTRLGLSLAAAPQPAYCGVAAAAVSQGWLRPGSAGCPISRDAAESTARRPGSGRVVESVLGLVSSNRIASVGHDHLAWLVVVQQSTGACQQSGGWSLCVGAARGFGWTQLALVDGHGAGTFSTLRLAPMGGQPPPRYPRQPATQLGA